MYRLPVLYQILLSESFIKGLVHKHTVIKIPKLEEFVMEIS